MATTTQRSPDQRQRDTAPAATLPGRQRRMSWMVAGVLLVVGCALAFALTSLRVEHGEQVLVLARSVPAGHVLSAGDLRTTRVSVGSNVGVVDASAESGVLGRPAAVPLVAGALLSPADVGPGSAVPAGYDVVAAALKAGAYPPDLSAGQAVRIVPVADATSGSAPAGNPVPATVLAVTAPADASGADAVVSLQVPDAAADQVVAWAAGGEVSLVEVPNGAGG